MNEKKEEWELGYSRENPAEPLPQASEAAGKSALLSGELLEARFLIVKDLTDDGADEGGLGRVYLAKDTKLLGRDVVVKVLQSAALENADIVRKFRHEKEALARLDHPGIVRILDSGEFASGAPFIVMEFIEGGSLRRRMNERGAMSFEETASIVEAASDALAAAHGKGIIHRDIKPENIMLTPIDGTAADRVRLIDFGIARVENSILAPKTEFSRGIGTMLYVAPEQLRGVDEQTPAADIYSLAVVVYEMLTGRRPFAPRSVVEIFEMQKEGVKTPPRALRADLPPAAEAVIMSALEFEPKRRPPDARAFGRSLASTLRGAPSASTSAPAPVPEQVPAATAPSFDDSIPTMGIVPARPAKAPPTPVEPVAIPVNPVYELPLKTSGPSSSNAKLFGILAGIVVAGLIAVAIVAGILLTRGRRTVSSEPPAPAAPSPVSSPSVEKSPDLPTVELSYSLEIIKPSGPAQAWDGTSPLASGDKFRINATASSGGRFYAFAEDKDAKGKPIYRILYPTPRTNGGSADATAGQALVSGNNSVRDLPGNEVMWLIWTASEAAEPEAARIEAFSKAGVVTLEATVGALRAFIEAHKPEKSATADGTRKFVARGRGEAFAQRVDIKHD